MLHIGLHFAVPALIALVFYRDRWPHVTRILVATMLVDLDHLLADPIYDPERCSIGFHPLHTAPAIAIYAMLFALPRVLGRKMGAVSPRSAPHALHLIGLGLLIHMALDWSDCVL